MAPYVPAFAPSQHALFIHHSPSLHCNLPIHGRLFCCRSAGNLLFLFLKSNFNNPRLHKTAKMAC